MDEANAESLLDAAERAAPELRGPNATAAQAKIDARYAGLLEAIDWFVGHDRTNDGLRLVAAMYPFWISKRRFDDGDRWFDRALSGPGGDDRLRAAASINAGFMPFWKGDDARARGLFGAGLDLGRRLADPNLTARALGGLARVALRNDVAEARRLAAEELSISDAAGDASTRSDALHLLGVSANIAGDLPEARRWMRERLALVRGQGNEALISSEAANLSMVERQLGNLDEAERLVREALEIAERRGDEFMKPFALSGLAAIASERHQHERAATLVGAAETLMEAQGAEWPPDEKPQYERLLAILPDVLGFDAFERGRGAGQAMTTSEAVAFALAARPPGANR